MSGFVLTVVDHWHAAIPDLLLSYIPENYFEYNIIFPHSPPSPFPPPPNNNPTICLYLSSNLSLPCPQVFNSHDLIDSLTLPHAPTSKKAYLYVMLTNWVLKVVLYNLHLTAPRVFRPWYPTSYLSTCIILYPSILTWCACLLLSVYTIQGPSADPPQVLAAQTKADEHSEPTTTSDPSKHSAGGSEVKAGVTADMKFTVEGTDSVRDVDIVMTW